MSKEMESVVRAGFAKIRSRVVEFMEYEMNCINDFKAGVVEAIEVLESDATQSGTSSLAILRLKLLHNAMEEHENELSISAADADES